MDKKYEGYRCQEWHHYDIATSILWTESSKVKDLMIFRLNNEKSLTRNKAIDLMMGLIAIEANSETKRKGFL